LTLLLTAQDADGLLDARDAIEVTRGLVLDYLAGTTTQMAPFGGYGGKTPLPRVAAGVLYNRARMNVRGGDVSMLYDLSNRRIPIAIMAVDVLDARVSGSMGLAATYLAQPDARVLALIGSGNVARGAVLGACAARPIAEIRVFSSTAEHRGAFATWAQHATGVATVPADSLDEALAGADIIALATSTREPLIRFDQLRPGTFVVGLGSDHELDESVYLEATQLVATSRAQMLQAGGSGQSGQGSVTPRGPLARLLKQGALVPNRLADLGAIVAGDTPARNGPTDVTVYLDARGGVADTALVSAIYDRARERGRGTDFDFQLATSAGARRTLGTS
jgi:alanine dehydrogenase